MHVKASPISVDTQASFAGDMQSEVAQQSVAGKTLAVKRHYVFSYCSSVLLLGGNLLLLRWANQDFGELGFSEFIVMRRFLSALSPVLSLGLAVTLAKTISQLTAVGDRQKSISLVASGYQLATLSCLGFLLLTLVVPEPLSRLVTGSPIYGQLLSSLAIYAMGLLLSVCNSAYCFSQERYFTANAIQLTCGAIGPLLMLCFVRSVESFFVTTGLTLLFLNLAFFCMVLDVPSRLFTRLDSESLKWLVAKGLPRTPGDAAYYCLLALPALVATRMAGFERGGEIGYALIVLSLLMQIAAPMNQFLLPEAAYLLQVCNHRRLVKRIVAAASFAIITTCAAVFLIMVLAPELVRLHLGVENLGRVEAIRWIAPAAIPLNLFICMRGVVDSATSRAVAPHICIGAVAVFLAALSWSYAPSDLWSSVVFPFHCAICSLSLSICIAAYYLLKSHVRKSTPRVEGVAVTWDIGRAA